MSDAATQIAAGKLDRIYDAIEAVLPGVTHTMVQMAVWDALDEFCTKSTFWRATVQWVLQPNVQAVNLNPVAGNALVRHVIAVRGITRWRVEPPATIVDLIPNGEARSGQARVVLKPSRLSGELPSSLIDDWHQAIRDGALAQLYGQPAKPYSSGVLAQYHRRQFWSGIREARSSAMRYNSGEQTSGWWFPQPIPGR